jgi:N-acetylglucosamine-6-phosphate deacetylase
MGAYVGPGFVDVHCHGANGKTTYFDAQYIADYFLEHGTTSFLATPSYDQPADEFLEAIRSAKNSVGKVKTLKGLYIEGPYVNVKYGAFADRNPWRGPIDTEQCKEIVDAAGDAVKVWTIAPEREDIVQFCEYARKVNSDVIFAVGHSEATPQQIRALGKYRPSLQTHSMCATGRVKVKGTPFGFGPDEYCFMEPDVYCELICDSYGIHVHSEMQRLLIHTKGIEKIVLITDVTGDDFYPNPEWLADVTDLGFDDKGGLSGSKLTMDVVCRNIMTHTNCGIAQAFVMASLNPAKAIGMDCEIGSIEKGKNADFVFVDDRFNVKQVMLEGELVL